MRIALVSSEVNYVEDNYEYLLNYLLERFEEEIQALILVRTVDAALLLKIAKLKLAGCHGISRNLAKNILLKKCGMYFQEFKKARKPILEFDSINSAAAINELKRLDLDLIVNLRTRNIYREEVLQIPTIGCINVHHGVLPKYRGTMCDLWALSEGRNHGFSIHRMNKKLDDGDILHVHEHTDIQTTDYSRLPYLSSYQEARDLADVINQLRKDPNFRLQENRSEDVVYSKTPSLDQVRQLRQRGIRL